MRTSAPTDSRSSCIADRSGTSRTAAAARRTPPPAARAFPGRRRAGRRRRGSRPGAPGAGVTATSRPPGAAPARPRPRCGARTRSAPCPTTPSLTGSRDHASATTAADARARRRPPGRVPRGVERDADGRPGPARPSTAARYQPGAGADVQHRPVDDLRADGLGDRPVVPRARGSRPARRPWPRSPPVSVRARGPSSAEVALPGDVEPVPGRAADRRRVRPPTSDASTAPRRRTTGQASSGSAAASRGPRCRQLQRGRPAARRPSAPPRAAPTASMSV